MERICKFNWRKWTTEIICAPGSRILWLPGVHVHVCGIAEGGGGEDNW